MQILFARVFKSATIKLMKNTSNSKKRMGRPPVDNPRSSRLPVVQVTPDQLTTYKAAAESDGQKFSQWVRDALDKAAGRSE